MMSRIAAIFCLAISLAGYRFSPPAASLTPPSASDWVGAVLPTDSTNEPILVHFADDGGTLSIQPKTATQAINQVQWQDTMLEFSTADEPPRHFAGQFDGTQITGSVEQGGQSSPFVLLPLVPVTDEVLSELVGVYRFADGSALGVQIAPTFEASGLDFFWHGLALNDYRGGAVRGLYPIAPDVFLVGSARVIGYPFFAQVTFRRDAQGTVTGLLWQTRAAITSALGNDVEAVYIPLHTETVRYTSADGITLTGLLTLPETPAPHPAMVVLHGSERGTRNDFGRLQTSAFLASQGFAVLTYDKRGVGDSGGTYQEFASESNLTLLAEDALAGVNYLKGLGEIDTRHIGLIGNSQAGWIIPIAAASSDVRFFVILSGPVVSVGIEDRYSRYTNNGDSPSPYSSDELSALLAKVPPSGFDPLPLLANLQQPGLWLWGDQDKSIPVPESVAHLKTLIAQGKSNFSYDIFENADHNLQLSTQGLFTEIPYSSGYPELFYVVLADWLHQQITS